MTELLNGEFEFRDLHFGSWRTGYPLRPGGYSVTYPATFTQDEQNPFGDGITFGEDTFGASVHSFDLLVLSETGDRWKNAANAVEHFRTIWRNSPVYEEGGAQDMLRVYHGSEPVVVFGRARHCAIDRSKLRQGVATITCDFQAVNDIMYADQIDSLTMSIVPATTGGLKAPLTAPLTAFGTGAVRQGYITVGGKAPAAVEIEFNGPVLNPYLELIGHWKVGLNTNIAGDAKVVVSAMRNTVLRGNVSLAGRLSRTSPRITDLLIPPGQHELVFGGEDPTGTASVSVSWREAKYVV